MLSKLYSIVGSLLFALYLPLSIAAVGLTFLPIILVFPQKTHWVPLVWSRTALFGLKLLCRISYEVKGAENIPKTPCIIASKHQSAWETIAYLSLLPYPCYILKKELLSIPIFGQYLRILGMIAIDRSAGVKALKIMLKSAEKTISKNRPIVIFPEGTRVPLGKTLPYHAGVTALYRHLQVPVIPVALNSGYFWAKNAFLKKPGKITIQFLPAIPPGGDKKLFSKILQESIEIHSQELLKEATQQ